MVIPFPAAGAAPLPLGVLLERCASLLEEGEAATPDPRVRQVLGQLRLTQALELIALPAPSPAPARFFDDCGLCVVAHPGATEGMYFGRHQGSDMGRWHWHTVRRDESGRFWRTRGVAVMDDFGDLVEVPE